MGLRLEEGHVVRAGVDVHLARQHVGDGLRARGDRRDGDVQADVLEVTVLDGQEQARGIEDGQRDIGREKFLRGGDEGPLRDWQHHASKDEIDFHLDLDAVPFDEQFDFIAAL